MASSSESGYSRRRSAATPSSPTGSFLARLVCCCVAFRRPSESTDQTLKASFFGTGLQEEKHGPDQTELLDDAVEKEVGVTAEEKRRGSDQKKHLEDTILDGVGAGFQESKSLDQTELLEPTAFNGARPMVKEEKRQGPDHTKLLGDDVLNLVFEFLGRGHFRPVAGTCHRFRRIYKPFDVRTSAEKLVVTTSGASFFYTEASQKSLRFRVRQDRARLASWPNDRRTNSVAPLQFIYDTALCNGRLEVVKWARALALTQGHLLDDDRTCALAACCGDARLLQWARANGCPWDERTCSAAASHGHLTVLQWARANGCPWNFRTCAVAAGSGHLTVLRWARANGCPWNFRTCAAAASNGDLAMLQWLQAKGCAWDWHTCSEAASSGYLTVLQWARANGCPWNKRTCSEAAHNGHLTVLQWARANGCPWDSFTCAAAASNGHLTLLQWARVNGCSWDERTCRAAAGNGHLTILEYATANRCPWDASTCSAAAGNGHLTVLEYAIANGCSWDARTCSAAAGNGHLNVLQRARAYGCPWDSDTCSEAARGGHLIVLQWARAYGCPWDEGTTSAAARNEHLEVLKWALYNDCPLKTVASPANRCERFLNRWISSSRWIDWNARLLARLLRQVVAQNAWAPSSSTGFQEVFVPKRGMTILAEVSESITLFDFDEERRSMTPQETDVELSDQVLSELRKFVRNIAIMHRDIFFHNFEHASHVVMSVTKLMSRIVAFCSREHRYSRNTHLHPPTYGIACDPLTQFACVFSALIHDVDHSGVPNAQLIKENPQLAASYQNKSVAEQNSLDVAWDLFMEDSYVNLRGALFSTLADLQVFRQLVVNCVMATDLFDSDLRALRNARWDKAFHYPGEADETITSDMNRKATIVIEHLMQAADVQHTMQHWHIYRKWNERLFFERKEAYLAGRSETDPANGWYQQELDFLDFYVIPLARKLKDCGVFGVSSDEYLNYAMQNRQEWAARGRDVVEEMIERSRDLPGTRAQKRWIQW